MGTSTRHVWVWVKFFVPVGMDMGPSDYMCMGTVLLYPVHTLLIAILIHFIVVTGLPNNQQYQEGIHMGP
jgi:hypothetical protein